MVRAGSVVVADVPNLTTVAGVPAKVIGTAGCAEPARTMNQLLNVGNGGMAKGDLPKEG